MRKIQLREMLGKGMLGRRDSTGNDLRREGLGIGRNWKERTVCLGAGVNRDKR